MHQSRKTLELKPEGDRLAGRRAWRRMALILMILLLPGLLGAWRIMSGDTIDPNYVNRIKNGKTTKLEILTLFGDPQEIKRTPEGVTYLYKSFKDVQAMPYRPENRNIAPQSDQTFLLSDKELDKKMAARKEKKILRSTLFIRFKPGGDTVMSHEYKTY